MTDTSTASAHASHDTILVASLADHSLPDRPSASRCRGARRRLRRRGRPPRRSPRARRRDPGDADAATPARLHADPRPTPRVCGRAAGVGWSPRSVPRAMPSAGRSRSGSRRSASPACSSRPSRRCCAGSAAVGAASALRNSAGAPPPARVHGMHGTDSRRPGAAAAAPPLDRVPAYRSAWRPRWPWLPGRLRVGVGQARIAAVGRPGQRPIHLPAPSIRAAPAARRPGRRPDRARSRATPSADRGTPRSPTADPPVRRPAHRRARALFALRVGPRGAVGDA